jgi:hypothetical protein
VIKSWRIRWVGHVARIGEKRNRYKVLVGTAEGNNHLKDLRVNGRITVIWLLKEWNERT